jgi:hypothetical protein
MRSVFTEGNEGNEAEGKRAWLLLSFVPFVCFCKIPVAGSVGVTRWNISCCGYDGMKTMQKKRENGFGSDITSTHHRPKKRLTTEFSEDAEEDWIKSKIMITIGTIYRRSQRARGRRYHEGAEVRKRNQEKHVIRFSEGKGISALLLGFMGGK